MFGQKKTLLENFLTIGPIFISLIMGILVVLFRTIERASYAVLLFGLVGTILIGIAKLPSLKEKKFLTFGAKEMTASERKYYFFGFSLVILSLIGEVFLLVMTQ